MKQEPAIVVVAYNRPACLERILSSLRGARWSGYKDAPLVISIDGGGSSEVPRVAERFEWEHGTKRVISHGKNIGLRKHILSCGELTGEYGSVIILEEDCYVSRNFYDFASQALGHYREDGRIAGISLYSPGYNESAYQPFRQLDDGYDVYFMQVPSSLGQIWTPQQWRAFRDYYDRSPPIAAGDSLPLNVIGWPDTSWKKYFYKYMLEENLFFVYPSSSCLTNFGDTGTHQSGESHLHQVPIEARPSGGQMKLVDFDVSCNKYDGYYEILAESLRSYGVDIDADTCVDLHGARQLERCGARYAVSTKECRAPLRSLGANLFPIPLNLIYPAPGNEISYGTREQFGVMGYKTRWNLIQRSQPFGCHYGMMVAQNSRYYRTSYALAHPATLPKFLGSEFRALVKSVEGRRRKKISSAPKRAGK
jgi:hypothetical protein